MLMDTYPAEGATLCCDGVPTMTATVGGDGNAIYRVRCFRCMKAGFWVHSERMAILSWNQGERADASTKTP